MKPSNLLAALFSQVAWIAPVIARDVPSVTMPADLAQSASEFDRAQIRGDARALQRLLADDYVLVNSGAEVENKAQFINDYTAPGATLLPYRVEKPIVRTWRNGAVLSGVVTLRGTTAGKPFSARIHFADVWRKCNGHWQVVFTQAMRMPVPDG